MGTHEMVERAWSISPDTIYGFILILMLAVIIILGIVVRYLYRRVESNSIKVFAAFQDNSTAIQSMRDTIDEFMDPDKRALRDLQFAQSLDQKLREYNNSILIEIRKK